MNRTTVSLVACAALALPALADDRSDDAGLPLDLRRASDPDAPSAPDAPPARAARPGRITGTDVHMRAGPGLDARIRLRFGGGNRVRILGREGAWVRVALDHRPGERGWVHGDYVAEVEPEAGAGDGGVVGLAGRLRGEEGGGRLVGELVADSRLWGGMLASPSSPWHFREVATALGAARGDAREAVAPLLWPAGSSHAPGTLRVFVQGLNTPRPDGPGFMGGDARIRRYLAEGYLSAPLVVYHNGSAKERTPEARRDAAAVVAALAERGAGELVEPEGPDRPLFARLRERLTRLAPLRRRDYVTAFRMRLFGFGAEESYTNREVAGMAELFYAALRDPDGPTVEVTGYSDGTLIVEHGLRLAARRLIDEVGATATLGRLDRVFLVYWGNATAPLVRGVRRLIVHDRSDVITTLRTPLSGRNVGGVATPADLPPASADDAVIVTFDTPWEGMNGHNALVAIGPALRAILRAELGAAPGPVAAPRVRAAEAPVRRLYERLRARGVRHLHVRLADLDVDWERYRPYLW